ncbi:MAG: hypothetical protein M3Y65_16355 [Pseudomonadota bacterium]|nr:hypothetical protein [Pseudomonadota bacterium]
MKYTILSPVDLNGKRHPVGASLDIAKADAAELLKAGAIGPFDPKAAKAVDETDGSPVEPIDPNTLPVPPETEGAAV